MAWRRTPPPGARQTSWVDRHPILLTTAAAAAVLGLVQSAFLVWRGQGMGGLALALGSVFLGAAAAVLTLVLLLPVIALGRRLLPAWRAGRKLEATWSLAFGLTAALATSILADEWNTGSGVPPGVRPWIVAAAGIVAGLAAARMPPWRRGLRVAAVSAPLLLLLPVVLSPLLRDGQRPDQEEEPQMTPAGPGAPDVVLISIDTLRADSLGAWGASPSITPEIDRLAAEGVVFRRALAASPWTIPSVASMLTGLPAVRHLAGRPLSSGPTFLRSPLESSWTTVAERFAAAGYRTRAVVANGFLTADLGMAQGFERFVNPFNSAMIAGFLRQVPLMRALLALVPPERLGDYRAQGVTDQALAWLDEPGDAPLFLWAHYIDPHSPYQSDPGRLDPGALAEMARQRQPPVMDDGTVVGEFFVATDLVRSGTLWLQPQDRERLRDYYDRAVRYTDQQVGRLAEALRQRARGRPVVVALTTDHGEEFWDHGQFEHGHDYYREVTAVPLLFWGPGRVPAGRAVERLAGLVDVAPTLLELAGLESPTPEAADEGRSLVRDWSTDPVPDTAPPRFAGNNLYDLPAVLVEEGAWRFILRANGQAELYDLDTDPQERDNLVSRNPETADRFRQLLEPRLAAFLAVEGGADPAELSPETLKALKALGYVD